MSSERTRPPKMPSPWFVHLAWRIHRGLYKISGGRFLWTPANKRGWGAMHLTTTGWRSGQPRRVIVGYLEDAGNLVVVAMNGWDEGNPAWWRNLEADPSAVVRLAGQDPRPMRAREAVGDERERLWALWRTVDTQIDAFAARRTTAAPVVVFEPSNPGTPTDQ